MSNIFYTLIARRVNECCKNKKTKDKYNIFDNFIILCTCLLTYFSVIVDNLLLLYRLNRMNSKNLTEHSNILKVLQTDARPVSYESK